MAVEIELPAAQLLGRTGGPRGGDFEIPPPPGDGGGGGGGGGTTSGGGSSGGGTTSSGGSSSGGSAPEPQDPYTAWYSKLAPRDQRLASLLDQTYTSWFEDVMPFATLRHAVEQGWSVSDLEDWITRPDSSWWKTDQAEDKTYPAKLFLYQAGMGPKPSPPKKKGKKKGKGGIDQGQADFPGGRGGRDEPGPGFIGPPDTQGEPEPQDGPDYIGPPNVRRRRGAA